jgi:hypothetical protein
MAARRIFMPIDKEKYRASLKPLGLTHAQEDEIITALYAIMSEFVTAAFGKSEAQLVRADRLCNTLREQRAGQVAPFVPRLRPSIIAKCCTKNPASSAGKPLQEG